MPDKPLILLGSSRRDLRAFPALPRRLAGFELRRVQQGLNPDDWKGDAGGRAGASGKSGFTSAGYTGSST